MFLSAIKKIILAIIRLYQATASIRQPRCRFDPSCSQYALEAVEKYGIYKGSIKAIQRISRCHPFGSSGYDPLV